jgi:hypothetical protein
MSKTFEVKEELIDSLPFSFFYLDALYEFYGVAWDLITFDINPIDEVEDLKTLGWYLFFWLVVLIPILPYFLGLLVASFKKKEAKKIKLLQVSRPKHIKQIELLLLINPNT